MTSPKPEAGRKSLFSWYNVERTDVYVAAVLLAAIAAIHLLGQHNALIENAEKGLLPAAIGMVLVLVLRLNASVKSQGARIEDELKRLQAALDATVADQFEQAARRLEPEFVALTAPHVQRFANNMRGLLQRHTLSIRDTASFNTFYQTVLATFPNEHFLATALPSANYFWGAKQNVDLLQAFIANGGRVTRTFWIHSEDDLAKPEAKGILDHQAELGVEVKTSMLGSAPHRLRGALFSVAASGRVGWTVQIDADQRVIAFEVTTDKERLQDMLEEHKELQRLPGTHAYTPR
ncbi:MAG: hypothetical protein JSR45_13690 [Proteobacteria bacterium]|nr:hypothetical protein [Pseudomonadota bacterium]